MRTTARAHRDERGTRLALWVGGGVVLLVVLLIGIGYYNTNIGPANDTAIVVGNHTVSLGYYRDRLKATTVDANQQPTEVEASNEESTTTDTIEEEQVYLQRAESDAGVSVSDNDITLAMAKLVQVPTQGNQISDKAVYESLLQSKLQREGLSLDQFRQIARANALKDKVLQKFQSLVPQHTLAVQLHELVFTSQAQGQAAQQKLEQGETFADLEQESVGDPSLGTATPVDWTPVPFGILPAPIDAVAAKLQPGEVSDLIEVDNSGQTSDTSSGSGPQWYLIEVTNRDSNYAVPDTAVTQIA
ncbi:MAG TPA: SurA N-terminal domain-containing protein, partial [Dehalococcoidia bacterium]|nr:SurA N-terminal domain-containing protein [Dehalococcoidia bacterium]